MKDPVDRSAGYVSLLLEAERAALPPRREVEDRVRARVAATLIAASTAGAVTTAATTTAAAKGIGTGVLASLTVKASLIAVVVVTASATSAVALHRRHVRTAAANATTVGTRSGKVRRGSAASDLPAAAVVQPSLPLDTIRATEPAIPYPAPQVAKPPDPPVALTPTGHSIRRSPATLKRHSAPETPEELAEESALLEAARRALGARDQASAATLLQRHAHLYPSGQMQEEREALWVQALVAAGDAAAAQIRAAEFRKRFPHSIQLPVVSSALETIR